METEQVIDTEVMEDIVESEGGKFGSVVIIAGSMAAGALLWDRGIKPLARWIKAKLKDAKKKHAESKTGSDEENSVD